MAQIARVLQHGVCEITQEYKGSAHKGIDIVKEGHVPDNIVAHSNGTVIQVINNCKYNTKNNPSNPGNMVVIEHDNGYRTRYLHLAYGTIKVSVGQRVSKGQVLGYMGNTGYSFGAHLHFEVLENGVQINPTSYLINDLPRKNVSEPTVFYRKNVGDVVNINGVYVSSTSTQKLKPAVTTGTITKILNNARNPYLLNNGNIGWVNDDCIISDTKYLHNPSYKGTSIVEALKQIGVDSSYQYRTRLAETNKISGYCGSASQNTLMLKMLKKGTLKSV